MLSGIYLVRKSGVPLDPVSQSRSFNYSSPHWGLSEVDWNVASLAPEPDSTLQMT